MNTPESFSFWVTDTGKGWLSTKKISTPEGRWRTVRKPGLDENSGFEWKNLYFQYQWPKRNSFQGYSFSNSILMQIWDTLITHSVVEFQKSMNVLLQFMSHPSSMETILQGEFGPPLDYSYRNISSLSSFPSRYPRQSLRKQRRSPSGRSYNYLNSCYQLID